ncbi:MAG: hypothetical protein U0575_08635 [Phycisphaerales bacterium]|jgi:hypothetical protein
MIACEPAIAGVSFRFHCEILLILSVPVMDVLGQHHHRRRFSVAPAVVTAPREATYETRFLRFMPFAAVPCCMDGSLESRDVATAERFP